MLACVKCLAGKFIGGVRATDDLGNNLHLGVVQNDLIVMDNAVVIGTVGQFSDIENVFDVNFIAHTARNTFFVRFEQIRRAAEMAQALEFIDALADGFDHPVTTGGTNLSGGQRQRLLVARALAGDPEIVILDDSSSALDYRTDLSLRRAIATLDTTVIVVAQRISSVMNSDLILVLDEGEIIGAGTHEELLESCEVYREISESQMGGAFVE